MRIRDVIMRIYPVRDYGKAKALPVSNGGTWVPLETTAIRRHCLSLTGLIPIRDNGNAKAFPISSGVRDIPLETMAIQKNCLSPTGYMLHGKAFEIRQGFFHVAMKIK